jgi:hypothetical protein
MTVRMYQVGFGDCFLLSLGYPTPLDDGRAERHILIDFGSMSLARGPRSLTPIAKLIRDHTGGKLDVVVVSHRHRDHLSGFGNAALAGMVADPGFPRLVVRSWTEHPSLDRDATGLVPGAPSHGPGVGRRSRGLISTLGDAQGFAGDLVGLVGAAAPGSLGAELKRLAEDQLKNARAVAQLNVWTAGATGTFLHYGMPSGIEEVVPGLSVRVLGPPTVDQHEEVATQRERDADEFWMIYQGLVRGLRPSDLLGPGARRGASARSAASDEGDDGAAVPETTEPAAADAPRPARPIGDPGPVRWLTDRMGRQQLNSLLRIVRILDDVLNNTSLILLFEVATADGPLRLLFPGDAQIENWEYALKVAPDHARNLELLATVDLYKVGHHGSRNATPRSLFGLWDSPENRDRPLAALMSTKCGVHGESVATAVPRKTLLAALDTRTQGQLYQSRALDAASPFFELTADLTTGRAFSKVAGPDDKPGPCPL